MGFFFTLFLYLATFLISELLRPGPKLENARPSNIGDFRFPTATEGRALPVIVGRILMKGPNVIWYGGLRSIAIRKKVRTGLFKKKRVTIGYRYYIGIHYGLCHAADNLHRIYVGDKLLFNSTLAKSGSNSDPAVSSINAFNAFGGDEMEGGMQGSFSFYFGQLDQPRNAYLQARIDPNVPAFRGMCHLVWQGGYIGTTAFPKNWQIEMSRYPNQLGLTGNQHIIGDDANPIAFLYEVMTDNLFGLNINASDINAVNLRAAATTVFNEGLGYSFQWESVRPAAEIIAEIERHVDGLLYLDLTTGEFNFILAREIADPSTLPLFDEDNFNSITKYSRPDWDSTSNDLRVRYADRTKRYNESFAPAQDLANFRIQGVYKTTEVSYPGVKTAALANRFAARDIRTNSYPFAVIEMETNRVAYDLHPGSAIRLTSRRLGFVDLVCRITKINYGELANGRIRINLVEDIFALGNTTFSDPADSAWTDPSTANPVRVDPRLLIEAPYFYQVRNIIDSDETDTTTQADAETALIGRSHVLMGATRTQDNAIEAVGYANGPEQTDYIPAIEQTDLTPHGELLNDYPARLGIVDTSQTLQIQNFDLVENIIDSAISQNTTGLPAGQTRYVIAGQNDIEDEGVTVFRIGAEWMAFENLIDLNNGNYAFENVWRGLLNSTPQDHSTDDVVYVVGYSVGISELDFPSVNQNVNFQLEGVYASGLFEHQNDTPVTVVNVNQEPERPIPPANVLIEGSYYPDLHVAAGDTTITWLRRNRDTLQVTKPNAVSETNPANGANRTYRYRVTVLTKDRSDSFERVTDDLVAGGSDTSITFSSTDEITEFGSAQPALIVEVECEFVEAPNIISSAKWEIPFLKFLQILGDINISWSDTDKESGVILYNESLIAGGVGTALTDRKVQASELKTAGKHYFEFYIDQADTPANIGLGVGNQDMTFVTDARLGDSADEYGYFGDGTVRHNTTDLHTGFTAFNACDTVRVLLDLDVGALQMAINNGSFQTVTFTQGMDDWGPVANVQTLRDLVTLRLRDQDFEFEVPIGFTAYQPAAIVGVDLYGPAVIASNPTAYWRLNEQNGESNDRFDTAGSNANLSFDMDGFEVTGSGSGHKEAVMERFREHGKWYWEITYDTVADSGNLASGIANRDEDATVSQFLGQTLDSWGIYASAGGVFNGGGPANQTISALIMTQGDRIGWRLNLDDGELHARVNGGTWHELTGFVQGSDFWGPAMSANSTDVMTFNLGQDTFADSIPAGYQAWGQGAGDIASSNPGEFDGQYLNGVTLGQAGLVTDDTDTAISLDGTDDYVDCGDFSQSLTLPVTISFAGIIDTTTGGNSEMSVATSSNNNAYTGIRVTMQEGLKRIAARFGDNTGTGSSDSRVWVSDNDVFVLGQKAHFVLVVNSHTNATLYVNGLAVTFTELSGSGGTISFGQGNFHIGRRQGDVYSEGTIDEVILWDNTALTADDVDTLYQNFNNNVASVFSYRDLVLGSEPVGYWRLGENAGVAVDLGSGLSNGTYTGTPTRGEISLIDPRQGDQSVLLTPSTNDYVNVPDVNALDVSSFSLEGWIYPVTGGGNGFGMIINKRNISVQGYAMFLGSTNGQVGLAIDANNVYSSAGSLVGLLSHVVVTYQVGVGASFFVNGLPAGTNTTQTSAPTTHTSDIRIGADAALVNEFDGYIDEAAVYSMPLSALQIARHYWAGLGHAAVSIEILSGKEPSFYSRLGPSTTLFDFRASDVNAVPNNARHQNTSNSSAANTQASYGKGRDTGAWYFEVEIVAEGSLPAQWGAGIANENQTNPTVFLGGAGSDSYGLYEVSSSIQAFFNGPNIATFAGITWSQGDTACFRVDLDNGTFDFRLNNGAWNVVTASLPIGRWRPATNTYSSSYTARVRDGSTGNSFNYGVPSGYQAWSDAMDNVVRNGAGEFEAVANIVRGDALVTDDNFQSFDFVDDSTDHSISAGNQSVFDDGGSTNGFALSMFIQPKAGDLNIGNNNILFCRGAVNSAITLFIESGSASTQRIHFRTGGVNNSVTSSVGSVVADETMSLLVTHETDNSKHIYINGYEDGFATNVTTRSANTGAVVVGNCASGTAAANFYDGLMQDLAVWQDDLDQLDAMRFHQARLGNLYRAYVMAHRPTLYFSLDDASGTTAVNLVEGTDGTYQGSPSLTQNSLVNGLPVANGAVDFTANTRIDIANAHNFISGVGTVMFWINPDWNTDDNADHVFLDIGLNANDIFKMQKFSNALSPPNRFFFGFAHSSFGNDDRLIFNSSGNAAFTSGETYFVVYTWDDVNDEQYAYFNGVLVASDTTTAIDSTVSAATGYIGETQVNFTGDVDAQIDEFAILDKALTHAEVLQLYNLGKA